jgi:hypothetical protein
VVVPGRPPGSPHRRTPLHALHVLPGNKQRHAACGAKSSRVRWWGLYWPRRGRGYTRIHSQILLVYPIVLNTTGTLGWEEGRGCDTHTGHRPITYDLT